MADKMTQVKALNHVLGMDIDLPTDVREKLEGMVETISKKNSKSDKPTANQLENERLKIEILDFMEIDKTYTITDLNKNCSAIADLSNQKINSLVRQLKNDELVIREEIKGTAYFRKAKV